MFVSPNPESPKSLQSGNAWISSSTGRLLTLMALTGSLEPAAGDPAAPSIRGGNVTVPAIIQVLLFFLGLLLAVLFGILTG